jgi:hypothetical protein
LGWWTRHNAETETHYSFVPHRSKKGVGVDAQMRSKFIFTKKHTFGFQPCVFDLRRLGQKTTFEINIDFQMVVAQNTNENTQTAKSTFVHSDSNLVFLTCADLAKKWPLK